ncbi:MAG: PKD domain-containing protein, partial [Anaerolineae bacterium]
MTHRVGLNLILAIGLVMALGSTPVNSSPVIREEALTRAADGGEDIIRENYSVAGVVAAFDDLVYWGEWLGFHKGDAPYTRFLCTKTPVDACLPWCPRPPGSPIGTDPTRKQHFQGIARSPRAGVPPILFVTRAGDPNSLINPTQGALWVLQMGSKSTSNEQLGERLRSNRLAHNTETEDTVPPADDKVINWIEFDQDYDDGSLDYYHPGGIQMVGDILAVSLEGPNAPGLPAGKIAFFDTKDPRALEHLSHLDIELPAGHKAAAVGITRLPDDHYGVVVFTGGDKNTLEFYMSSGTDILDSSNQFEHYDSISEAELEVLAEDRYWNFDPAPSSVNFVNEANEVGEALYLIGARNEDINSPIFPGDNQLYLWQVTGFDEDKKDEPAEVRNVSLDGVRKEVKKWLRSKGANSLLPCHTLFLNQLERQEANLNASAGAYVSPTGELLYYGTSFWNLGPSEIIRMAELHHKEVSHTGACGPQFRANHLGGPYAIPEGSDLTLNGEVFTVEPWVSLYKHDGWDEQAMNERVIIDWADMKKDDYWLFNRLDGDFNDEVSSFRWCGPEGATLELFDSKPTEDFSELHWEGDWEDAKDGPQGWISCAGTGLVYGTRDFDYLASEAPNCQHHGGGSAENFEEDVTSARFRWTPPTATYGWLLDGEPGPDNLEPIESGKRAIFHAGRGSSTHTVELTVWSETVSTLVEVYNVPPTITITNIAPSPADEGQEVTLSAEWSDPGAPEVTTTIRWGDSTTDPVGQISASQLTDPFSGSFEFSHVYADNGTYTIQVRVNDGEAEVCVDREMAVNNVAPTVDAGLDQVIYEGDVLTLDPATFNDQGTLDTHTATVDWGDGSPLQAGLVSESPFGPPGSSAGADGTVEASHQYLGSPGDYTVTVCVTDDDGAKTCAALTVTVVHGFLRFCAYADDEHPGVILHHDALAHCA